MQMPHPYDILIVGAGPAGCAAAYDLAFAGKRVLLLDKRTFPRPKACACGLTRKTLKALRYSVDAVTEGVCHEIVLQIGDASGAVAGGPHLASETWATTDLPAADRSREIRVKTRNPICAMAVRERFDDFCLQKTLTAGAQLKKIDSILALRELPNHIELDIATPEGMETLTAPVLIGADGSNGQTRRLSEGLIPGCTTNLSSRPKAALFAAEAGRPAVSSATDRLQPEGPNPSKGHDFSRAIQTTNVKGASTPEGISVTAAALPPEPSWYARGFALEATVPYTALPTTLPAGDAPHDLVFDFAPLPGGYGWLFPKGDHINIGVGAFAPVDGAYDAQLKSVTRALLMEYSLQKLGIASLDNITGQYLGMGGHAYVPRGRVLLVGDAAGLVDPLTGEGIHSAIVSGQAAAAAILKVFAFLSVIPEAGVPGRRSCLPGWEGNLLPSQAKTDVAAAYAKNLRPLQETLAFSLRAAKAFYAEPDRGFKAMRFPLMRSLVLKTYADGLPYTKLLTGLAKLVT
jgi:flavin-dependent dehydrogenase